MKDISIMQKTRAFRVFADLLSISFDKGAIKFSTIDTLFLESTSKLVIIVTIDCI